MLKSAHCAVDRRGEHAIKRTEKKDVPGDYRNGVWINDYTLLKADNARLTEPMDKKLHNKKVPMVIFENVNIETHVDTRFDVDPATRGCFQVSTEKRKRFGLWLDDYERTLKETRSRTEPNQTRTTI